MSRNLIPDGTAGAAVAFGLDAGLKVTLLLLLALIAHAVLGRRASLRSALWNACLAGLVLLPLASASLPRLRVACLPGHAPATTIPAPVPSNTVGPDLDEAPLTGNGADRRVGPTPGPDGRERPVAVRALAGRSSTLRAPQAPVAGRSATGGASSRLGGLRDWSPGWAGMTLLVYAAGAGVLATRLAGSLVAVAHLRRGVIPVDEVAWVEGLERGRARLGITQRVPLVASDRVTVPVVVGWLRPLIVLPRPLAGPTARGTIDAVLLHELAHVRRGDYAWNLVLRIAEALYWFHPLIRVVGRLARVERERACDDFCIHSLGEREQYRTTLLEVARALTRWPGPALGMAMAVTTPAKLARRLAWIETSVGSPRCRPTLALRFALAAVGLGAGAGLGAFEAARQGPPDAPARVGDEPRARPEAVAPARDGPDQPRDPVTCEVAVIDRETEQPLAGATVNYSVDFKHLELQTDGEGRVRIPLAGRTFFKDTLSFDVWDESHVQQRLYFTNSSPKYPPIPDRVTVSLLRGSESFGGLVRDEEGRPIAGATVRLWGHLDEKRDPKELLYMVHVKTDAQGRWQLRGTRRMKWVNLYIEHPDFLSDVAFTDRRVESPMERSAPGPTSGS